MWILFLGDVVGKPGRRAVREFLSRLRSHRDVDLVVANGENVAGGVGVTGPVIRELFDVGVD
ncbi:MAG: metallophosphoesterase, partial [Deltaproteobacteria bacterium]|nr:metallophosphoesterase [Deltaproteobacteria bacterium]